MLTSIVTSQDDCERQPTPNILARPWNISGELKHCSSSSKELHLMSCHLLHRSEAESLSFHFLLISVKKVFNSIVLFFMNQMHFELLFANYWDSRSSWRSQLKVKPGIIAGVGCLKVNLLKGPVYVGLQSMHHDIWLPYLALIIWFPIDGTARNIFASRRALTLCYPVETHFSGLPDLQIINIYTNPTYPNLTRVSGATLSMP